MPAVVGRSRKQIFAFLRDRVWARIKGWGEKKLSRAGKEVLIKAVLQAIPTYVMNCFLLPDSILRDLEMAIRRFWWGHGANKGMAWLSWSEMCKSKEVGGLGFRDLKAFNLAMITKQAWRIFTNPQLLLSQVMLAKYFPHGNLFNAEVGVRPSATWRCIWKSIPYLRMGLRRRIGDGTLTSIWADPWLLDGGSRRIITKRPIMSAFPDWVSDIINGETGTWNKDRISAIFWPVDVDKILAVPLGRGLARDRWVWQFTSNGKFSVGSCYHMILAARSDQTHFSSNGNGGGWRNWKFIWKLSLPPKVVSFIWRWCRNILPTNAELCRRRVIHSPGCDRCNEVMEDSKHVIFSCNGMEAVWQEPQFQKMNGVDRMNAWGWVYAAYTLLPLDDFLMAMIFAWKAWERRNRERKGEAIMKVEGLVGWCTDFLATVKEAQPVVNEVAKTIHPSVWHPPAGGYVRINYDVAVSPQRTGTSIEVVARGPSGRCIGWRVARLEGNLAPAEGEARAALEALTFAEQKGWNEVEVEGHCLQITKALQAGEESSNTFGAIIEECQFLASKFHSCRFKFIKRSGNMLAHALAHLPCKTF